MTSPGLLLGGLALLMLSSGFWPRVRLFDDPVHYLALHTALELLPIIVSSMIFALFWHLRERSDPALTWLGTAFLGVALIDFVHLLSYSGMPPLVTPSGAEKAIHFWLGARTLSAAALLFIAFRPHAVPRRNGEQWAAFAGVLAVSGAIITAGLWYPHALPRTFMPDTGLTPFKIGYEYALALGYVLASALLLQRGARHAEPQTTWLGVASGVLALTELFFTLYDDVTDLHNLCGHLYKVLAYGIIYATLYTRGIRAPQAELMRTLDRLNDVIAGTRVGTWEWNVQTGEVVFNERWAEMLGYTLDELAPVSIETWTRLAHPDDLARSGELLERHFKGELDYYECEARIRHKAGHWIWVLDRGRVATRTPAGKPLMMSGTHQDITERKAAEAALSSREAFYRQVFEVNTAIKLVVDPSTGQIVDANPAAVGFYGQPRSVLKQMAITAIDIAAPEAVRTTMNEALQQHRQHFQARHRLANGEVRDVEVHSGPVQLEGRTMLYSVIHDVTDRVRQEQEIHDLYNHAPCGYHSLAPDGTILRINDTELDWLGLAREDVIGKMRIADLLTPASRGAFRTLYPEFKAHGQIHDVELEFMRRDGSTYFALVSGTAVYDEHGEFQYSRSVAIDYTRLKLQQDTLNRVLAASPMAVRIAALSDGRLLFSNQAYTDFTRAEPNTTTERHIRRFYVRPEDYDDIRDRLRAGEVVQNRLVELRHPEHPEVPHVWALASYMTISFDDEPAVLAWLFDVTGLQTARTDAEAANRAKSAFLANMSHEIRTPLNAMLGLAYLLEQSSLDEETRAHVNRIHQSGHVLLGLVNDILDLAKIEAGEFHLERVPFSLGGLLGELGDMLEDLARSKGLKLAIAVPPTNLPDRLVGDPLRLRQILVNLLNNAIKFTERGEVRLDLTRLPTDDATTVQLRFDVVDTGIGISGDQIEHLFAPFTQADTSTTRRFGGTGLGLSIVRQLVEQFGGGIDVSSQPGEGSTFSVVLSLPVAAGAGEAHGTASRQLSVLVASDEPVQRAALASLARGFGWAIDTAVNAEEMIERIRVQADSPEPVDCLIIEWPLPGLNETDPLAPLRATLAAPHLPCLVISGATEACPPGAEPVTCCPVRAHDLFNAVDNALRSRHAEHYAPFDHSRLDHPDVAWLPGVRVLLVDDSELNRDVARRLLQRDGALVDTCADGQAALDWLHTPGHVADIVLMDVQMPVMDGNTAVRALRSEPAFASLPVIALTAGALLSERERSLKAGMDDYLTKPFDPQQVVRVIRRHVERVRDESLPVAPRGRGSQSATHWPDLPGVDSDDARMRMGNDLALYQTALRHFVTDYPDFAQPGAAPDSPDQLETLRQRLHRFAGNAGQIGARALYEQGHELETRLRAGDPEALDTRLAGIARRYRDIADAASVWLSHAATTEVGESVATDVPATATLERLRAQLDVHDLEAMTTFSVLKPVLRTRLGDEEVMRMNRAIQDLRFDEALAVLDRP